MNSRKNVKIDGKTGWKLSRLIRKEHANIGSLFLAGSEKVSANFQTENAENAWVNLELAKAYADNLRNRII